MSSQHTYAIFTMGYHKIQVSKFFKENWFQFLDDCEILLRNKLTRSNDVLTILNQVKFKL